MRSFIIAAVVTAALLIPRQGVAAGDKEGAAKEAALAAAKTWLALVDEGNYGASWEQGAALFRGAVNKDGWVHAASEVRGPLGVLKQRKLKSAQYATSLPGAPDGEYVVIQFDTAFELKASAVETVTPMLDKDGKWRVSGYYIK